MSRFFIALCSTFAVLVAGCQHAGLPTLPASHGHLSMEMARHLLPASQRNLSQSPGFETDNSTPQLVVEPAQAPEVFAEAVRVLEGEPTAQQVHQAWEDLGAACEARLQQACDFLKDELSAPRRLELDVPPYPAEAFKVKAFARVILRCLMGADGRVRDCEVIESAPFGLTEAVHQALMKAKYIPLKLAGHPLEVKYAMIFDFHPPRMQLTPEQHLQWARARAARFPESAYAWADLARLLAWLAPEDAWYAEALAQSNARSPRYWWPANELAWLHVQAGRYTEALPLATLARERAPRNAYVLETFAAVMSGLDRCPEALAEQRRAVEALPSAWPEPERQRFLRTQQEYALRCQAPTPNRGPAGGPP